MREIKCELGRQRVRFGDVVRQVKKIVDPELAGVERYVAGEHLQPDDLRIRSWGDVGSGYLGPAFQITFEPGQVLYGSRRTYLRKVAVADFAGICANTTFVLEPKTEQLHPALLPLVMQTQHFTEHSVKQSRGSVNPYVNFSDLAWYEFSLPQIGEQERIAVLISAVDDVIEGLRTLVRVADHLRRSVLLDAFRARRGSVDTWPAHWRAMRADAVGDVQLGQQRHPKYAAGLNVRPYLRVANVMDGRIDFSDVLKMHFPTSDLEKFELLPGDILLNEGQSTDLVGRSAIYRGEVPGCCFQKTLLRYRCGPELIPEFVQGYFQHRLYTGQFARMCVQTTSIAHLTAVRFAAITIPVPSIDEQREFAERVAVAATACVAARQRLSEATRLRVRLLDELLSGDVH